MESNRKHTLMSLKVYEVYSHIITYDMFHIISWSSHTPFFRTDGELTDLESRLLHSPYRFTNTSSFLPRVEFCLYLVILTSAVWSPIQLVYFVFCGAVTQLFEATIVYLPRAKPPLSSKISCVMRSRLFVHPGNNFF